MSCTATPRVADPIAARTAAAIEPPCAAPSSHLFRAAHLKWEGLKGKPEKQLHDLAYGLKDTLEDHEEMPCNTVKKPPVQKLPLITLIGKLTDGSYQRCKKAAEFMSQNDEAFNVQIVSLMPTDYELLVKDISKAMLGKSMEAEHKANVLAFEGSITNPKKYIGGPKAFMGLMHTEYGYSDKKTNSALFERLAKVHLRKFIEVSGHTFISMNIFIGDDSAGKILIECYDDVCPKTVQNFISLVKGDTDAGTYEGCPIHRIVPQGWIQSGDVISGKGDGGKSVFGETFGDETFYVKHDKMGIVGVVNKGPHTNASQFYITLAPLPWMDGKAVGLGYVVDGMRVLRILEKVNLQSERPVDPIRIEECKVYTC
uniref:PPIase cyclophilin-type domain-containing protein n=1 Tax=Pyramimonas obovata TaxID=1411642 RepID=A0A7S0R947_9CHLO|mmetsp:Transcript_28708/g.62895  ORF Transcript_28708/g.62895 Transcript_28708/m.62895 type:complete len:370 (+) Transcript_28708:145-1254(+)|eukprot:CAMPEP_0118933994 /NCGR_PEP_ID=MMETSP1169-20130426/13231_1 /TAXON_ID=36882 /ORGANISM="Pyramimonas obovata, Strain CCMP722" /LENGTH=369 /DNA_ID=CAMNT_0006876845 /DNA_START=145 /DNA_END=1254 /DNA_ORIENTATION=+